MNRLSTLSYSTAATKILPTLPTEVRGWQLSISERTRIEAAIMLAKLDAIEVMTDNSCVLANAKVCRAKVNDWLTGNCLGYLHDLAPRIDHLVASARWHSRDKATGGDARRRAEREAIKANSLYGEGEAVALALAAPVRGLAA